jgi:hypothetical protein
MVPAELDQTTAGAEAEADLPAMALKQLMLLDMVTLVWGMDGEIPQLHCREEILQQLQQVVLAAEAELTVIPAAEVAVEAIPVVVEVTKINRLI